MLKAAFNTTFYAYSNGDILYTDNLVHTLISLTHSIDMHKPGMIIGKRTNVDNVTEKEASSWTNISAMAKSRGKLFIGIALDYFITTRIYPWKDIAEVVIGRIRNDNWLVFYSRKHNHTVIDATQTILAVHQTTKAGNFEGHGHKNSDYNNKKLAKLYKRFHYNTGSIDCSAHFTKYENDYVIFTNRSVPQHCTI